MAENLISKFGPADQLATRSCVSEAPSLLSPVLGQKRSFLQIPVCAPAGKVTDTNLTPAATEPDEPLLKKFERLMPLCRELMRHRIFSLNKRKAKTEIARESQLLPEEAFDREARELFIALASRVLDGRAELLAKLWRIDYQEVPPTIDQFVNDDRFLGQSPRPQPANAGLWPTWSELLQTHYDLKRHYSGSPPIGRRLPVFVNGRPRLRFQLEFEEILAVRVR